MISDEIKQKIAMTDYTFHNGQYKIRDGRLFSRVTSVIGMIKFDDGALDIWRKKMQIRDFTKRIDIHGTYKGSKVFDEFALAMDSADTYMKSSASFGTRAHAWIEEYMKTGEYPPIPESDAYANIEMCLRSVQKFFIDSGISPSTVEVIKPELFVYSEKYGYAGSADFLCGRGENIYLFDWKTSNSYRIQYAIQLAAYAKAIEELYGLHVNKGNCVVFNKEKPGYDVHTYSDKELDFYFELFKACLIMHNFVKNYPIPNMSVIMEK